MEKDLLIHQLLEGSLDTSQEDSLFLELSSNDELRKEFKEQLLLKNAMQNDTVAFTPKADSTTKIFSELGISEVLGASAAAASSGFFANFWSYFQLPLASSLATAAILASTFIGLNQFGIITFGKTAKKTEITEIPVSSSIEIKEQYNNLIAKKESDFISSLNQKNSEISSLKEDLKRFDNQINVLTNQINKLNQFISSINIFKSNENQESIANDNNNLTQNNSPIEIISIDNSEIISSENISLNSSPKQLSQINSTENFVFENGSINQLYLPFNFALEFGGFLDNQLGEASNLAQSHLDLQGELNRNLRLAVYNQIGNWKVGFDVRRENFYQRFSYTSGGQFFLNEQNPNFWSFGGFTRYNPGFAKFNLSGIQFEPFGQLTAGFASPAGPVGRVMLGSEVSFLNYNHFTFGLEYSFLQYQQSGIDFQADKISLQIGIGIGSAK